MRYWLQVSARRPKAEQLNDSVSSRCSPELVVYLRLCCAAAIGGVGSTAQPESDPYGGVVYRGNKIETGALPKKLEKVTRALKQLVTMLRSLPGTAALGGLWTQMKQHEESMAKIGGDTLKASDIFYSCRFCRKLFK